MDLPYSRFQGQFLKQIPHLQSRQNHLPRSFYSKRATIDTFQNNQPVTFGGSKAKKEKKRKRVYGKPVWKRIMPWTIGTATASTVGFVALEFGELAVGVATGGILLFIGHLFLSHLLLPTVMFADRHHGHRHGKEVLFDSDEVNRINRERLEAGKPPATFMIQKGRNGELIALDSLDELIDFLNHLHQDAETGIYIRKEINGDQTQIKITRKLSISGRAKHYASRHEANETAKVLRAVLQDIAEVVVEKEK